MAYVFDFHNFFDKILDRILDLLLCLIFRLFEAYFDALTSSFIALLLKVGHHLEIEPN